MVFWVTKFSVSKFDGTNISVSDMERKKYSESTLCLKLIAFVEKKMLRKKFFRCTSKRNKIF